MDHDLLAMVHSFKVEQERAAGTVRWPSSKYARDPVGFCQDVLGFAPTAKQAAIAESVRDHDRTATPAARKVGKSRILTSLALWHFTQFEDATVVLVAPCERQITEIVWYDLVQLYHASGRCLSCRQRDPQGPRPCAHSAAIDGELSASVRTGLRAGARRIIGLAPRNADNARGISGPHQLWLIDESSGVSKAIYEAADGNRASGAKLVVAGNPVSRATWFFDACQTFHCITVASTESPNVVFGRRIVPGLADRGWIEEKRTDWGGEDDPRFQTEVMGQFPTREAQRIVSDEEYAACVERWETMNGDEGPLYFGIDPAGGRGGDKSAIVARRGSKVLELRAFDGATDLIIGELDVLVRKHRKYPHEPIVVNFDASSFFGADLAVALRSRREKDEAMTFRALEMKGDKRQNPVLREARCARLVDAYWLNLSIRLRADVGLPFDENMRAELIFAEWREDDDGSRILSKREYRKRLGRSPDITEALMFSMWEGRVAPASHATARYQRELDAPEPHDLALRKADPYSSTDRAMRGGAGGDPYAFERDFGHRARRP